MASLPSGAKPPVARQNTVRDLAPAVELKSLAKEDIQPKEKKTYRLEIAGRGKKEFFQSFSSLDSIIADMASRNWQLAPEAFAQKVRMSDGTALSPEDASIPGPLAAGLADARPDITFSYCSGEHQDEYAQWLCNGQHCRTVHCFAQAPAQDFEWFMGVMKISSGHRVVYRMRHGQGFMMPGFTPDKFGDYKHFVAGLAGVPCIRLILTWRRI